MNNVKNVGIVGFGLMGQQRAKSLQGIPNVRFAAVFDTDRSRGTAAREKYGCDVEQSWKALLSRPDLQAVIVAVPHYLTREIVIEALRQGKHVLCEKPLGRTVAECDAILEAAQPGQKLAAGFNYRFYPGIQRAKELLSSGAIGNLRHLRFVLGHGGRPGYESEWKTSKELCGGGALLDPGIHVIDLIRFLGGEVQDASADLFSSFWKTGVEDNVFATLRLEQDRFAQIHVSLTEWKSRFSLDLIGSDGMIQVRGRSGFYGPQSVELTRRWDWLQDPAGAVPRIEYPHEDRSFAAELQAFFRWIDGDTHAGLGTGVDARKALEIVGDLYSACTRHAEASAG